MVKSVANAWHIPLSFVGSNLAKIVCFFSVKIIHLNNICIHQSCSFYRDHGDIFFSEIDNASQKLRSIKKIQGLRSFHHTPLHETWGPLQILTATKGPYISVESGTLYSVSYDSTTTTRNTLVFCSQACFRWRVRPCTSFCLTLSDDSINHYRHWMPLHFVSRSTFTFPPSYSTNQWCTYNYTVYHSLWTET